MTICSKEGQISDCYFGKVTSAMRPHEKLDVWKRAIDFVVAVYKITESFPRDERFGLISQIRRAAVSIPANIAEGLKNSGLSAAELRAIDRENGVKLVPRFA